MNKLQEFYNDKAMMNAVAERILKLLEEEAINRVMHRKDTEHIAEAKDLVEQFFDNLEAEFGEKKKPKLNQSE